METGAQRTQRPAARSDDSQLNDAYNSVSSTRLFCEAWFDLAQDVINAACIDWLPG